MAMLWWSKKLLEDSRFWKVSNSRTLLWKLFEGDHCGQWCFMCVCRFLWLKQVTDVCARSWPRPLGAGVKSSRDRPSMAFGQAGIWSIQFVFIFHYLTSVLIGNIFFGVVGGPK